MYSAVLCFDLDGTLVDDEGRMHPADRELLRHEREVLFVPATGRSLDALRRTFARNGVLAEGAIPFPLVLQNGALTLRPGERPHAVRPLDAATGAALLAAMQASPEVAFLLFTPSAVHELWPSEFSRRMVRRFELDARPWGERDARQPLTKVNAIAASPATMQDFLARIAALPLERSSSLPTVIELNAPGTNKGDALAALLADLGLGDVPLLAAGDGENDLPLFARATRSFAPDTAPAAIQARASQVVPAARDGLLRPMLRALEALR